MGGPGRAIGTVAVMADQSPVVLASRPPLLRTVFNPNLRLLLSAPVTGSALKAFMVLKFKGHKTGRQFTLPLNAHLIDNDLYALSIGSWRLNFRGGAAAEVVHAGKSTTMHGELSKTRWPSPN